MNSFNPIEAEEKQEKIKKERNDIIYQLLKNAHEMQMQQQRMPFTFAVKKGGRE